MLGACSSLKEVADFVVEARVVPVAELAARERRLADAMSQNLTQLTRAKLWEPPDEPRKSAWYHFAGPAGMYHP